MVFICATSKASRLTTCSYTPWPTTRAPPIALDDVEGAEFFRVKTQRVAGAPVFAVKKSSDLTIRMVDGSADRQQKASFEGQF